MCNIHYARHLKPHKFGHQLGHLFCSDRLSIAVILFCSARLSIAVIRYHIFVCLLLIMQTKDVIMQASDTDQLVGPGQLQG